MSVTLVTATGDRPEAFRLAEKRVSEQTAFPDEWVVVDDGKVPTEPTKGQTYIRLDPKGTLSDSFRFNMAAALGAVKTEKVLFWEDDDWYSRFYVEAMSAYLESADLVGEARCKYYNVVSRHYRVFNNTKHASLCQTGIKGKDMVRRALKYLAGHHRPETLDGGLWQRMKVEEKRKFILPCSTLVIGIKGMPGRSGLGDYGHRTFPGHKEDFDGSVLKRWLGDDALDYWFMFKDLDK